MSSIKAHQRYKLRNGDIVPGVTTILDSQLGWSKRVLMAWSRREALDGNDPDKILRETGDSGTCTHKLIEAHINSLSPNLSDFSQSQIGAAQQGFAAFLSWERCHELEYLHLEYPVVSEIYRFGGTIDIIARFGGLLWLIDLKTSKGLYPEFIVQVAAYGKAYEEQDGQKIDEYHLLQLSKDGGGFQHHRISPEKIETAWQVFEHCRGLYDLQKKLRGAV